MEVLTLDESSQEQILSHAERILRSGGIVVGPTDTVYGIFADATDPAAIQKVFSLKNRPNEKAFPIFVKGITTARHYAYISDAKAKILRQIWPGPVTAIFHHKEKLPKILTGELDTIGIRIPRHSFLLELLSRLDFPLLQTSANISTKPPATAILEISAYFAVHEPDLVIDGGIIAGSVSTVVDFTGENPRILRTGIVSKEELDRTLRMI